MKKKSKELLYIWMTAVSFTTILLIVFVLIYVIFINSVGHFWTSPLQLFQLQGGEQVLGIMQKTEKNLKREERIQVKIGSLPIKIKCDKANLQKELPELLLQYLQIMSSSR